MKKTIVMAVVLALLLTGCMNPQQINQNEEPTIRTIEGIPDESSQVGIDKIYERLFVLTGQFSLGIYLAEVTNNSPQTQEFAVEKLVLKYQDGEVAPVPAEFLTVGPTLLAPGESGFVTATISMTNLTKEQTDAVTTLDLLFSSTPTDETPRDTSLLTVDQLKLDQAEATVSGVAINASEDMFTGTGIVIVREKDGSLLIAQLFKLSKLAPGETIEFSSEIEALSTDSTYEDILLSYVIY